MVITDPSIKMKEKQKKSEMSELAVGMACLKQLKHTADQNL